MIDAPDNDTPPEPNTEQFFSYLQDTAPNNEDPLSYCTHIISLRLKATRQEKPSATLQAHTLLQHTKDMPKKRRGAQGSKF